MMCARRIIAAVAVSLAATPAAAQMLMPGGQPVSAEVAAAFAKVRTGDRADLMRLAEAGRPDAQTYAGLLLAFTSPSADDQRKGCGWIEAASTSRSDAMHTLAESYQYGRCGGKVDLERAMATFHKAGDMGMAKSRCAEGNLLIQQKRDLPRAVDLCRQGAEGGDADAQTDLGNIYLRGEIVPKDAAAAAGWYERAVALGHRNAAFTLGQMYWYGDGVAKSPLAAERLWKIAYDKGRTDAAVLLGNAAFVRAIPKGAKDSQAEVALEPLLEALDWYAKVPPSTDAKTRAEIDGRVKLLTEFKAKIEAQRKSAKPS